MSAVHNGKEKCVRVLIAANADLAYEDIFDMTALHYAADYDQASICRVLVNEGASLTAVNGGQTPLELAKKRGNAECVAILEAAAAAAAVAV